MNTQPNSLFLTLPIEDVEALAVYLADADPAVRENVAADANLTEAIAVLENVDAADADDRLCILYAIAGRENLLAY